MSRKWKILLACVVAVTAACAAAWYLLPRPAVGGDYEAQYINVGETLENITGHIRKLHFLLFASLCSPMNISCF